MSKFLNLALLVTLMGAPLALADIYCHNPRGSNNRLDEARTNTRNQNRLFDSQNNAKGGYNVGSLYYYAGSNFMFEWTSQHASNNPIAHNEFILQFMCDEQSPGIRDGTTTNTIRDDPEESKRIEYGQHEDYLYYQSCKKRSRNYGLFTADQLNAQNKNNKNTAIYTRQDNNGNRYGFECPEERDYYPYWHPSPWVDMAVLTSNMSNCDMYWRESENVSGKGFCTAPEYNNQKECTDNGGSWQMSEPNGFPSPVCFPAPYTRDNHLGNAVGGYAPTANITMPDIEGKNCIFRVRYNISTADFDGWNTDARHNTVGEPPEDMTKEPLVAARYPDAADEEDRVVYFKGNPEVDIGIGVKLQLNINTDQFARTFQDRSHTFEIRKAPDGIDPKRIHNLNVRGKRGNIVQVYPAVEYDFVPNVLVIKKGDYVHLQWTGSNTNPNGNDGEGKAGTDRSNFVQVADLGTNFPLHMDNVTMFEDKELIRRLALLDHPQFGGETSTLDDAGTYFDAGLIQFKKPGTYHYASTRNNNFSNRSQKGTIIVEDDKSLSGGAIAGIVVGSIVGGGAIVGVAVAGVLFVTLHQPTRQKLFRV